jgi:ribonuclease VapC
VSGSAIDASALIAFLRSEPGADVVAQHLRGACMSAVNLSEVLEKSLKRERTIERVLALLHNWQVDVVSFDIEQATIAAQLKAKIGNADVSFADRACLALAMSRAIPAVTADRVWRSLSLDAKVILIRGELN